MSFCENCGIQLNDGANFCRGCGKPTGKTPQGQTNDQPQNAYQPQNFSSQQSYSSMSNMSVWQGFINGWKKYAVMRGRSRRTEYWGWVLFSTIFSVVLSIIDTILGFGTIGPLNGILSLAILIPGITITVRRLHDIGRSGSSYFWLGFAPGIILSIIIVIATVNFYNGYFYSSNFYNIETMLQYLRYNSSLLFFFILTSIWSFVGGIILLVYCCTDSTQGENQYGPNPKWESSQA